MPAKELFLSLGSFSTSESWPCHLSPLQWDRQGRDKRYPTLPLPLTTCSRQETWPWVVRAGELALFFTSCSTHENGPCSLPGQHSRADLRSRALASQGECGRVVPTTCLLRGDMGEGEIVPLTPCHLQQAGELAIRLSEQESCLCLSLLQHSALERSGPEPCLSSTV